MLVDHHALTVEDADRSVGLSSLRHLEAEELLRAVTALHLDGMLSEAEYQAKRQRLASRR